MNVQAIVVPAESGEAVQQDRDCRKQRTVQEDDDGSHAETGGIGKEASEADDSPGEIEDQDVEKPGDDGEQWSGDLSGAEDEGEKGGVSEETEEDVERRDDESVGEGGTSGTAEESVKKGDVRGDRREAPGHESNSIERKGRAGKTESAIPSDDAEDDFGSDLGGDRDRELLNYRRTRGRKMRRDINRLRLRVGREQRSGLFGQRWRGLCGVARMSGAVVADDAASEVDDPDDAADESSEREEI